MLILSFNLFFFSLKICEKGENEKGIEEPIGILTFYILPKLKLFKIFKI